MISGLPPDALALSRAVAPSTLGGFSVLTSVLVDFAGGRLLLPSPNTRSSATVTVNPLGMEKHQRSWWLTSVWLIIMISCFSLCSYQIGLRIDEYIQHPIQLDMKIERQSSFDFPSVTLCSGMLAHRIKHFVNVLECEKNSSMCSEQEIRDLERLSEKSDLNESWIHYETKVEDLSIGMPCPTFFGKSVYCSLKPASELMNTKVTDTIWGRCLSLTLKNKTMSFKGPLTWISINWKFKFNRTGDELLYFFVHREDEELVHEAPFIADTIRVDYESTIRVTAKEYHALNTRNKPCVPEETTKRCFYNCVEKILERELICRLPIVNTTKLEECDDIRKIITAFRIADDVYGSLESNTCNCPRKCFSLIYKMSVDGERKTNEYNRTKLILHFADDEKEQLFEKSAFAPSALISEIGGSLGLYLGVNIITIVHLVEYLISWVIMRTKEN